MQRPSSPPECPPPAAPGTDGSQSTPGLFLLSLGSAPAVGPHPGGAIRINNCPPALRWSIYAVNCPSRGLPWLTAARAETHGRVAGDLPAAFLLLLLLPMALCPLSPPEPGWISPGTRAPSLSHHIKTPQVCIEPGFSPKSFPPCSSSQRWAASRRTARPESVLGLPLPSLSRWASPGFSEEAAGRRLYLEMSARRGCFRTGGR